MKGKKIVNPACHTGFYEVHRRLFVGRKTDIRDAINKKIDVLVPLAELGANIWDYGFKGEVFYSPIHDFGVLPEWKEKEVVEKIIHCLTNGKKVAIFCVGGHGRTGYIAACVLAALGYKDPISVLWGMYCKQAIESYDQLERIAAWCEKPDEMKSKYSNVFADYNRIFPSYTNYYTNKGFYDDIFSGMLDNYACADCLNMTKKHWCKTHNKKVELGNTACDDFISLY